MRKAPCLSSARFLVGAALLAGCAAEQSNAPPPNVQRPVIKTEAELAAERAERIRAGEIIPTSSPALAPRPAPSRPQAPAPVPAPGAIEGDILLVNNTAISVAEVLYALRFDLVALRGRHTPAGFADAARRAIRRRAQEEIGSVLVYAEATGRLEKEQMEALDAAVNKEVERITAREHGGSVSRLTNHLREFGLTREQWRDALKRELVVRQYTREKLLPQVQVRRDELLSEYQRNLARYSQPETRELLLIEAPFERFLAEGRTWDRATAAEKSQAKLKAVRRIREAEAALLDRPFPDVAREYSLGLHAEDGGSWGLIGRPLQPPYEEISKLIFEYAEGQISAPLETEAGWFIVCCGRIAPATQRTFVEVQDEIRSELMERRFRKLSVDYVIRLAEHATVSSLDAFVTAAVQRAEKLPDVKCNER